MQFLRLLSALVFFVALATSGINAQSSSMPFYMFSGVIFEDVDNDQTYTEGKDIPIPNVKLELMLDAVFLTDETDADGIYNFQYQILTTNPPPFELKVTDENFSLGKSLNRCGYAMVSTTGGNVIQDVAVAEEQFYDFGYKTKSLK